MKDGKQIWIKKYLLVFGGLLIAYMAALLLCFCIPNKWVQENYQEAESEFTRGSYWMVDDSLVGTRMDGCTDQLILDNCLVDEEHSVLYNMMDVKDYARYWHGYLILVRPLLCVLKYKYIKYVSMLLCFVLLCIAYQKVSEVTNQGVGIGFVLALSMGNIIVVPLLFQYMSMYYLTVISVILYCIFYQKRKVNPGLFFMVVGSLTNFFDFLTSPLNSLGILLVLAFLLYVREMETSFRERIRFLIQKSFAWVCGYGFTWLAKWCVASVILQRNMIADAFTTILFRTVGNEEYPTNRIEMLRQNLGYMLPKGGRLVLGIIVLCWLVLLLKRRYESREKLVAYLPVLICAVYPFLWYLVLANHSQIHSYFTYRTLETSIFAVLAFMAVSIKDKKRKKK